MSKDQTHDVSVSVRTESPTQPKIFISYSWTSPGHREQVPHWAERLIQDGIDVVLDVYDLKEGHDKYSFMEKMATDPDVTHVLVVCDKGYSVKADAKKQEWERSLRSFREKYMRKWNNRSLFR